MEVHPDHKTNLLHRGAGAYAFLHQGTSDHQSPLLTVRLRAVESNPFNDTQPALTVLILKENPITYVVLLYRTPPVIDCDSLPQMLDTLNTTGDGRIDPIFRHCLTVMAVYSHSLA